MTPLSADALPTFSNLPDPTTNNVLQLSGLRYVNWGFSDAEISSITTVTGSQNGYGYGFTFSDLAQRFLPKVVLDAYPTGPVDPKRALEIARNMSPTPPFQAGES